MHLTIQEFEAMVAAGASAEVLLLAVRPALLAAQRILTADAERRERNREQSHKRVTRYRALRNALQSVTPSYSPNLSLPSTEEPSGSSVSGPNKRKRQRKRSLPEDWNPVVSIGDGDELQRFRDYAKANGKLYADWDAAWRNWKSSPYRKPNGGHGNGNGRRQLPEGNVSVDDIHELAEQCRKREAEISRADLFRTPDDERSRRSSG